MTAGPRGPAAAGPAQAAGPAGQTAEVSWFDTREITLGPADLAGLDARESARAAAFVFPADRHRYQVAHVMLRPVTGRPRPARGARARVVSHLDGGGEP